MPRRRVEGREIRLTFCTNVLPGTSPWEILENLDRVVVPVREAVTPDEAFGLGLWLPAAAAEILDEDPERAESFGQALRERALEVFTLNGFPFGDFHGKSVKEKVFLPSWAEPERLEYTLRLGRLLATWLDRGEVGSISTLSGGLKRLADDEDFHEACARQLLEVAARWDRLREETGREIVLALEMEPCSTLETTDEALRFFQHQLLGPRAARVLERHGVAPARVEEVVRRHLGLCYDVCHQAVEWEDTVDSLDRLDKAGIRIAKLQVSNALELPDPADPARRELLARFAEPRYLHQVSREEEEGVAIAEDLPDVLEDGEPAWLTAPRWRVHFHVPVHRTEVSGLPTTRPELERALHEVLRRGLCSHLEVETYTWGVLPEEVRAEESLVEGLAEEMRWTLRQVG